MDSVKDVVEGVKKATLGDTPQRPQGQKKEKKEKKKGGDAETGSRPLEVSSYNIIFSSPPADCFASRLNPLQHILRTESRFSKN